MEDKTITDVIDTLEQWITVKADSVSRSNEVESARCAFAGALRVLISELETQTHTSEQPC